MVCSPKKRSLKDSAVFKLKLNIILSKKTGNGWVTTSKRSLLKSQDICPNMNSGSLPMLSWNISDSATSLVVKIDQNQECALPKLCESIISTTDGSDGAAEDLAVAVFESPLYVWSVPGLSVAKFRLMKSKGPKKGKGSGKRHAVSRAYVCKHIL